MSVELTDNASPMLIKLFKLTNGLGMQALSKGASQVAERMTKDSKSVGMSEYHMRLKNGHRIITSKKKNLYDRYDHKSGRKLKVSLGDLIRFKQYQFSNTVLVGFLDTKGYTSLRYEAGVPRPFKYVDGTQTKAIAKRMAEGGRINLTRKQRGLFYHSGFKDIARRGYVERKPHPFMNFITYFGIIESKAQSEWRVAINQFKLTA